jgi:hypothetical protein
VSSMNVFRNQWANRTNPSLEIENNRLNVMQLRPGRLHDGCNSYLILNSVEKEVRAPPYSRYVV